MRTTRLRALLAVALTALGLAADADPPRRPPPPEVPPGLALLRPEILPDLERRLGVPSLRDLPRYEIDQALDDVTGTLAARLTLTYTNLTGGPLDRLPLLLHPNAGADLGAPSVSGALVVHDVAVGGRPVTWSMARPGLALVRLPSPLPPGGRIVLAVRYAGRLRVLDPRTNDIFAQGMAALAALASAPATDYGLLATGDGITCVASAYPMVAAFREGGFDTSLPPRVGDVVYNGVASFRVRTVVPAGMTVVTNLVDQAPRRTPAGDVVVSEGALVRDLVLVAGRDLARTSVAVGPTRVTSVHRARDARAGRVVLAAASAALASYERRFGPYPYTELDVAEASLVGGAGGVEFSAMVLVAGMLYRDPAASTSPLASLMRLWSRLGGLLEGQGGGPSAGSAAPGADLQEMQLEFTVAHEVAHQYFAGIVGNDSHRHPSLDEPLAQYAAGLAYADRHGAAAGRAAMDANVKLNYALYRLLGGVDRPASRDTASFRTSLEYAGLVYGKAPYVYAALRDRLGAARLERAICAAVARHRFRIATTPAWIDALEVGAGGPASGVRATFRRWFDEAHGDTDLGVDDSGDFVLATIFPPDVAAALRGAGPVLGMRSGDLLRMLFGGGLGDDAPLGTGIDPEAALRALERLGP